MKRAAAGACAFVALACLCARADDPAATYNAAGVEAYEARRFGEAAASFAKAHELSPNNPTVRRNLCNAYQASADEVARKADYAAASELLESAIAVDPKNTSPLVQLASYYLRLNLVPDAVFRLKEAIELNPKLVDAHELLGDAYYRDNHLADALAEWEWVNATQPGRPGLKDKLDKATRESSIEAKFGRTASRHFRISYAPGTSREEQTRVLSILERAFVDIGQKFGGVYPPSAINVIIYTAKEFSAATQLGEHVGALYDGKIRVPLKDQKGQSMDETELKRRLYHEYVHVVVRFLCDDNVPWWLNEGLAETFSRDDDGDRELLRTAQTQGKLFPLSALEGDQLNSLGPDALRQAYAQAHTTAAMLVSRFGPANLAAYLTALAEGKSAEEALEQCYRRNYALLDREVANRIASEK